MKSIQLFKLLQQHAGKVNHLAVQLYNAEIETADALDQARAEVDRVQEIMAREKKE
jgi:hypothetical protein